MAIGRLGGDRAETVRFPGEPTVTSPEAPRPQSHAFCVGTFDLASVSKSVRSVSKNVRQTPPPVSANLRRELPLIARRASYDCAPLQLRPDRGRSCGASGHTRSGFPRKPRTVRQQAARPARQTNRNVDQSANAEINSLNGRPGPQAPSFVPCLSSVITASRVSTVSTACRSSPHGPAPLRSVT